MFSLIRNALLDTEIDDETKVATVENIQEIYKLSKHNDVAHLVSYAIAQNGISLPDEECVKKLKKRHPIAVLRYENTHQEFCRLVDFLENERIPFIENKRNDKKNKRKI